MESIKNVLKFIYENWATIIAIIGIGIGIYQKIKAIITASSDERIAIARRAIQECILKFVTDSEIEYQKWAQTGEIKRAEVINKIYEQYPILKLVKDQNELIAWIDAQIDGALIILRDIIEQQKTDVIEGETKDDE